MQRVAGQRQPIELVVAKGKKHLTKAEIEERQKTEVKAAADKVTAPQYLSASQKKTFKKIAKELRSIDLISNLDVDALARLVIAQEKYIAVTEELNKQPIMIEVLHEYMTEEGEKITEREMVVNAQIERLALLQDRYFKQCRQGAADFGLTVSSRCRLTVPKTEEAPKENKFAKFA